MQTSLCASKLLSELETEESSAQTQDQQNPVALDTLFQDSTLASWHGLTLKLLSKFETEESPAETQEKQNPVAFDIPFQNPTLASWHIVSLAKERLEKYGGRKSPEAYQKLEETHRQKCQQVEERLIDRKEKARRHNEKVAERMRNGKHLRQERAETKEMLEEGFQEICQKAEAQLNKRSGRHWGALLRKQQACQHNEEVANRVQDTQQQQEERQNSIQARWEQKKGSRVKGERCSRVDREGSRSLAGANNAGLADLLEDTVIHPTGNECLSLCALPMNILNAFLSYLRGSSAQPPCGKRNMRASQCLVHSNRDMQEDRKITKITKTPMTDIVHALEQ